MVCLNSVRGTATENAKTLVTPIWTLEWLWLESTCSHQQPGQIRSSEHTNKLKKKHQPHFLTLNKRLALHGSEDNIWMTLMLFCVCLLFNVPY